MTYHSVGDGGFFRDPPRSASTCFSRLSLERGLVNLARHGSKRAISDPSHNLALVRAFQLHWRFLDRLNYFIFLITDLTKCVLQWEVSSKSLQGFLDQQKSTTLFPAGIA